MTRPLVTSAHIDVVYDALTLMSLLTQRLSHGEVGKGEASDMSWLLGAAKRRLEPIADLLEEMQIHQADGDAESLTTKQKTNRPRDVRQEATP